MKLKIKDYTHLIFNGVEITIFKFQTKIGIIKELEDNNIEFIDGGYNILIEHGLFDYLCLCFEYTNGQYGDDELLYYDSYTFLDRRIFKS